MKKILFLGGLLALAACTSQNVNQPEMAKESAQVEREAAQPSPFYAFQVNSLEGKEVDLSQFKGKKILVVNVASECGYTPQYKELQQLYREHGDKVTVLGFPANNFGGQEPGSSEEIAEFCEKNYGVTFPMFEKVSVVGEDQHPLYRWLSDKSQNGVTGEAPSWNFSKYLLDEQGPVVAFYPSKVSPLDEAIVTAIQK
ncbi:glutathione peroxidase [soil metagenome]